MDKRSVDEQLISGFLLAGKTLLAILVGGAFFGGIAVLRSPQAAPLPNSVWRHPFFPWAIVIIATAILILTMDRWVTILPGCLGYGTVGGLIMLGTGQYNKMSVPRPVALALTLFCVASSALTFSFTRRRLTLIDRFALLAFLFCLALSMSSGKEIRAQMVPIGVGSLVLLFAWAMDFIIRRQGAESSGRRLRPTT